MFTAIDELHWHDPISTLWAWSHNPIRWADPSGQDPYYPYGSKDDAAFAALNDTLTTSIAQGLEYSGLIYQYTNGSNSYYYIPASQGTAAMGADLDTMIKLLPSETRIVGSYHTHPTKRYTFGLADKNDLVYCHNVGGTAYVATKSGEVARTQTTSSTLQHPPATDFFAWTAPTTIGYLDVSGGRVRGPWGIDFGPLYGPGAGR